MKKILVFCAFFLLRIEGHTQSLTYPWQAGQTVSASGLNAAFSNRATFSVSPLTKYSVLLGNGAGDIMPMGSLGLNGQILTSTGLGLAPTWADLPTNSNPMTAIGDMITGGTSGVPTRFPIGTSNQVLTVIGGLPMWSSSGSFTTIAASGAITSTLSTGTAPFVVSSTTNVANLNAASVNGATFSNPGSIGAGTPGSGAFTTLSASSTVSGNGFSTYLSAPPAIGGLTPAAGTFSTLTSTGNTVFANGTSAAPSAVFAGAATTGLYWANPGIGFAVSGAGIGTILSNGLNNIAIGATTPSTAAFTTVAASDVITSTISTGTAPFVVASTTPVANLSIGGNAATATTASGVSGAVAATTLSASSTVSGTGFSTYLASPPAIGGSAPAAGSFTTLAAGSTVSGIGFLNYFASPPAIGGSLAAAGSFTTLSASSTVSGTGFSTYLASPPAIGGSAPAAGAFTTLSASSTVSGSGFSTYLASPPAIGGSAAAAGSFTTLSASSTVSGTGFTNRFATPGPIGNTVASTGAFTTLQATSTITPSSTAGIVGTTAADNAQAGSWGEVVAPTNLTSVSLTTDTAANLSSVSLTAGDYDATGVCEFIPNGATVVQQVLCGVSTTSATMGASGTFTKLTATFGTGATQDIAAPMFRVSIAGTTTVYLVGQERFTTNTAVGNGFLKIRRVR